MDLNALMRQAQTMQKQMQKKQKEVEDQVFEVSSNGGAIIVTIQGNKNVLNIKLDEDLVEKDNKDMLEDMLTIAVNEAIKKVEEEMAKAVSSATGGMKIPGMF